MERQTTDASPDTPAASTPEGVSIRGKKADRLPCRNPAQVWRRANLAAIAAYNRFVDEHGIWNQRSRAW
jgi:Post-segregation antitoxin CcdA